MCIFLKNQTLKVPSIFNKFMQSYLLLNFFHYQLFLILSK